MNLILILKGTKTYIGLDLSRADDLTAVSFIHLDEVKSSIM